MSSGEVETTLHLPVTTYEDDDASIHALRVQDEDGGWSFVDPDLTEQVAKAIREYPNQDAPQWLAPTAVILLIEQWLIERGVLDG